MSFKVSSENGGPSGYDYYSNGSEVTVQQFITTPEGMTTSVQSARVNPHQNENDTRPIGTPGTTYTPHREDKITRSPGGHMIIMGDAAGSETMRLQSKHGATVEMSSDGRLVMTSPSGHHVSVGGDGHLVFAGELHIVTNGDIRFKGADMHFDCHSFNVHASGDMIHHVNGSFNQSVVGDSHTTTQGDASTTVGGTTVHATAGDMKIQASGDMNVACKGNAAYSSVGDTAISSKGKMTATSKGDMSVNSKGKLGVNATGDLAVVGAAKVSVAGASDVTVSAKGKLTAVGDGGASVGGKGALVLTGSAIDAVSGANKASPDWVGGGSGSAPSASDAKVEIEDPTVVVPDEKQILDNVGDYVATEGGIDKIYSSSQLDDAFNTEEGGKIPDKVMARAKALGVIDDSYKAPKGESYDGGDGYAQSTYSSGMAFNPGL